MSISGRENYTTIEKARLASLFGTGGVPNYATQADITAIQVGGRNLIINSSFEFGLGSWINNGGTGSVINDIGNGIKNGKSLHLGPGSFNGVFVTYTLALGQIYTISFWTKLITKGTGNTLLGSQNFDLNSDALNIWTYRSYTVTGDGAPHPFYACHSSASETNEILIDNIKLEIGTKATDWTPALEDNQTQIDNTLLSQGLELTFLNVVNCTTNGNTITKTGGVSAYWDSGVTSQQTIGNGQYVEFTALANNLYAMAGLNHTHTTVSYSAMDFLWYFQATGILAIYETNVSVSSGGAYAVGDIFRIAVENNKINYYQNGILIFTSAKTPTLPLMFDCSIYSTNAGIGNVKFGTMISGLVPRMVAVETAVANVAQIGGRNLVKGSDFETGVGTFQVYDSSKDTLTWSTDYAFNGTHSLKTTCTTAGVCGVVGSTAVSNQVSYQGQTLTLSWRIRGIGSSIGKVVYADIYDSVTGDSIQIPITLTANWRVVKTTKTMSATMTGFNIYWLGTLAVGDVVYADCPQVELGTVATDWSPAPEDYAPAGYGLGAYTSTNVVADANLAAMTGFYYFSGVTNSPSGVADGNLMVMAYSASYVEQIFYEFNGAVPGRIFTRKLNNAVWGSWSQLARIVDTAPSGFGLGTIATDISSQDLNTVTRPTGFYKGSAITNAPDAGWWYVLNITHDTLNYTYQEVIAFGSGNTYAQGVRLYRTLCVGVWSAWTQSANTADTALKVAVMTGTGAGVNVFEQLSAYTYASGTIVGTMKITLPFTWTSTMMNIVVKGYDYSTNGAYEIILGGYNYAGSTTWVNCTATSSGPCPFTSVRFAHDGAKCCILLGTLLTSWSYPKIYVDKMIAGFSNITGWGAGWTVGVLTSETGIVVTGTPVLNAGVNVDLVDGYHASVANAVSTIAVRDASAVITANSFTSQVAQGTAPLVVVSTTQVSNLNATYVGGFSAANLSPPGQVSYFAMNTPPSGWLKANGALLSRVTYAALFSIIGTTYGVGDGSTTFGLPDLRGYFIRSWDDSRGIDTSRVFGSYQADQNKNHGHTATGSSGINSVGHTHTFTTALQNSNGTHRHGAIANVGSGAGTDVATWTVGGAGAGSMASNFGYTGYTNTDHTHGGTSDGISANHTHVITVTVNNSTDGGAEVIVKNLAMLACIKY